MKKWARQFDSDGNALLKTILCKKGDSLPLNDQMTRRLWWRRQSIRAGHHGSLSQGSGFSQGRQRGMWAAGR